MAFFRYCFLLLTFLFGFYDFFHLYFNRIYVLNISLLFYTILEFISLYKKKSGFNIFLTPIFPFTILVFFTNLGAYSSFLFCISDNEIVRSEFYSAQYISDIIYVKTFAIINFAYLFSWLGFNSRFGNILFSKYYNLNFYKRIINSEIDFNKLFIILLFAYAIKFYLFSIGLYGRSINEKYFEAGVGYKVGSEIRIFSDLSYLVFFLIAFHYFKYKKISYLYILIVTLSIELLFGFISGARTTFIYPFLILLLAELISKNKLTLKWLYIFPFLIIFTFTVVLNYKNYSLSDVYSKSENPLDQISDFIFKKNYLNNVNLNLITGVDNFFNHSNHSQVLATAINYNDNTKLNHNDPDFITSFVRVPYDAFVPKFIQGETEFAWGLWFKNNILNHATDLKYSISMTSVGFCYFTGGILFVLFIFFMQGVILNFVLNFLSINSDFSIIFFILLFSHVIFFDSVVSNYLTLLIRYLFIFPVILYFLFSKRI